jgi:hypothetical protein
MNHGPGTHRHNIASHQGDQFPDHRCQFIRGRVQQVDAGLAGKTVKKMGACKASDRWPGINDKNPGPGPGKGKGRSQTGDSRARNQDGFAT